MKRDDRPEGRPSEQVGACSDDTPEVYSDELVDAVLEHAACLADAAIAAGITIPCPCCDLVAVPDVSTLALTANGERVPVTPTLRRDDGRSCQFFSWPLDQRGAETREVGK